MSSREKTSFVVAGLFFGSLSVLAACGGAAKPGVAGATDTGRAMEALNLTRDYIARLDGMVLNIRRELPDFCHPCMTRREVKSAGIIVIGGERGLCGGFNHELHRFAMQEIQKNKKK